MKTIFISAGHDNKAPGAVANGVIEANLAVELRNAVAGHLMLSGFDVVKDGTGSENLPLSVAVKMIAGKALAIEIHFNASVCQRGRVHQLAGAEGGSAETCVCHGFHAWIEIAR